MIHLEGVKQGGSKILEKKHKKKRHGKSESFQSLFGVMEGGKR